MFRSNVLILNNKTIYLQANWPFWTDTETVPSNFLTLLDICIFILFFYYLFYAIAVVPKYFKTALCKGDLVWQNSVKTPKCYISKKICKCLQKLWSEYSTSPKGKKKKKKNYDSYLDPSACGQRQKSLDFFTVYSWDEQLVDDEEIFLECGVLDLKKRCWIPHPTFNDHWSFT